MDGFLKVFLTTLVSEFDELPEREKFMGVDARQLASGLATELGIDEGYAFAAEYHGSEPFMRILNTTQQLSEANLLKFTAVSGGGWLKPTPRGRALVEEWDRERRSPASQGQRILRRLYDLQQDILPAYRRMGKFPMIDIAKLCVGLDIDQATYLRSMRWAERQGYVSEPSLQGYSVENGGVYITDDGMNAVDNDFKEGQGAPGGPTINIQDSEVYGNILAAGRDAMSITSPAISGHEGEIRELLSKIQEAVESLPETSDERHDALQELESLQREISKDTPVPERAERSLNVLGSLASIGVVVAPYASRLTELLQQIPH